MVLLLTMKCLYNNRLSLTTVLFIIILAFYSLKLLTIKEGKLKRKHREISSNLNQQEKGMNTKKSGKICYFGKPAILPLGNKYCCEIKIKKI